MKFEISNQKENPFLKRKELELAVDYEGGPAASKAAVSEFLQRNFSAAAESIEIVNIFSEHGAARGKARARIWEGKAPEKKVKKKAEAAPAK
ncbi:MAG TPA: hypothetical protein VI933_02585 [archaeon]|nr:hypothetical protein [archaeon]